MSEDLRLKTDFLDHHKTRWLRGSLGAEGVLALLAIWSYAARHRPSGDLGAVTSGELAAIAGWAGDPDRLLGELIATRWIDRDGAGVRVRGWADHQPWVAHTEERRAMARDSARRAKAAQSPEERSRRGREAVEARWARDRHRRADTSGVLADPSMDTSGVLADPSMDTSGVLAPSPSPSPSPSPYPKREDQSAPHGARISDVSPDVSPPPPLAAPAARGPQEGPRLTAPTGRGEGVGDVSTQPQDHPGGSGGVSLAEDPLGAILAAYRRHCVAAGWAEPAGGGGYLLRDAISATSQLHGAAWDPGLAEIEGAMRAAAAASWIDPATRRLEWLLGDHGRRLARALEGGLADRQPRTRRGTSTPPPLRAEDLVVPRRPRRGKGADG